MTKQFKLARAHLRNGTSKTPRLKKACKEVIKLDQQETLLKLWHITNRVQKEENGVGKQINYVARACMLMVDNNLGPESRTTCFYESRSDHWAQ